MKTYKVTRTETIQVENIFNAKNEEQAINIFEIEKGENPQILSSDTIVEEIKKGEKR